MYFIQQSGKYVKDTKTPVALGLSYVRKVAHLQVVVVAKAVWGIFNNTNGLYLQVNTSLVIYKSRCYSIYDTEC